MDPIQQVTEWYQTYLGRDPDPGGLQAYTEALSGGADPGQLVASITGSPEARAQVSAGTATPATQQASTLQQLDYAPTAAPNLQQQQVIDLYQQFLGRNPDPASLSNDVNLLKSNPAAYGWLVDNVANSPEAKQAAAIGKTKISDSEAAQQSLVGKYGYTYPRTNDSGGLYGITNSVIQIGTTVAIMIIAPEIGAEILASTLSGPELAAYQTAVASGQSASTALASTGAFTATQMSMVGAAAAGSGSSAISSAMAGKNAEQILKAASISGGTAALGAGVAGEIGEAFGAPGEKLTAAQKAAAGGAGGATAGFTRAQLGGANLGQSLRQGAITGLSTGAGSLFFPTDATSDTADRLGSTLGKTFLGYEISKLLTPTATTPSRGGTTQTAGAGGTATRGAVSGPSGYGGGGFGGGGGVTTTGEKTYAPGSQALAQVLNLGSPTSAFSDTGAGGEKVSGETGGKPQNVWNLASLRVKDETGGEL